VTGAQLVCVLCEGDVADPVHAVLDRPVPAGPSGQLAGGGLLPGQVGDGVDGPGRPPPRAQGTMAPGDPQHLAGVREQQVVDGDGPQLAVLLTAVAGVVAAVHHRDLVPGQGSQLFRQVRLVSLHGHQVVRVALPDEAGGVIALGVQRIHRHHRAAKVLVVDVGQQRGERRDLAGLRRDLPGRSDAAQIAANVRPRY